MNMPQTMKIIPSMTKHPMQPVVRDEAGILHFRENAIVRALLDRGGLDLDQLLALDPSFSREDRGQIVQLLGRLVDDDFFAEARPNLPDPVALEKEGHQPQPMQPVVQDARGVLRFRENAIVCALLDRDTERGKVYPDSPARSDGGLHWIAMCEFSQEDQEQFAQLIGYSISGYHELPYVSDESASRASARAHEILPGAGDTRGSG